MAGPKLPPLAMARQGDIKASALVPSGNRAPCRSHCKRIEEAQREDHSGVEEGKLSPNRGPETSARDSLRRHA